MIRQRPLLARLVIVAAVVGACAGPSSSGPPASAEPPTAGVRDAAFGLTLAVARATYAPGDPIAVSAAYTYLGPKEIETAFHAAQAIGFRIDEIGGGRRMEGGMDMPCLSTDVVRGRPVPVPFVKSGAISEVPGVGFDRAWYEDPVLSLPAGRWLIVAALDVDLGGCGGERHSLEAAVEIAVEP